MPPRWIIFSFIAPAIMGVNTVVDKIILTKHLKNPISYLILLGLSNILYIIPATFLVDIDIGITWIVLSVLSGIILGFNTYLFLKVMQAEDATKVSILIRLIPIFALPISAVFLKEILHFYQYIGIFLLAIGGMVISAGDIDFKELKLSKSLMLITVFNIISATGVVVHKIILQHSSAWALIYWLNIGYVSVATTLLMSKKRKYDFINDLRQSKPIVYGLRLLTYLTFLIGSALTLYALKDGFASIVLGISSIQPMVVFIYVALLSILAPKVLIEDLSKASLKQKILSLALVVIGGWLVV